MYSFLLKKALPFALTFIFGAALSALVALFWSGRTSCEAVQVRQFRLEEYGRGRRECRMRRHDLVAESKPLTILNVPGAHYYIPGTGIIKSVRVNVTFGADGKVQKVEHLQPLLPMKTLEAVERAARQIEFTPETINSVPVTVEKEVEIDLVAD
jgi:hypothetical protein